ncbi:alcohol dehydrogenase class IV [Sinobacterium caligoides]|uniref:Alcohol dehydrogenase class IV n=1 Tax=Sinobacterium caligoides TaxID=933926 RepID=A0A3N2DJY9_9GAMM|nr:iron-containing alcohol dehydrogenase [Sinobacterium caligoides]ROS00124.1 alcohol dehydrogenase class IV [Sinobacterium caligoides]
MLSNIIIEIRRHANKVLDIPLPLLVEGEGKIAATAEVLQQVNGHKPLIITDAMLVQLGLVKQLTDSLDAAGIDYAVFDEVTPDPTLDLIERGLHVYQQESCGAIIALGGGSPMDCAKAIGACHVKKKKSAKKLCGTLRIRKALPPFIAIPTTAGTGSECTLAAVVTDPKIKQKFAMVDPVLVPDAAILDPALMRGLPAKITAETGIDALTHAVESYIGKHATEVTKAYGYDAVKRIFANLPRAYSHGDDMEARSEMAIASYNAGAAFTRASLGYVHAIAHQLGGYYHITHGLANAVILPHILEFSFEASLGRYAELAVAANLADENDTQVAAAHKFIAGVKALNASLNIQQTFPELKEEDIPLLAKRAIKEAFGNYPVPKNMSKSQCEQILKKLLDKPS